MKLIHLVMFSVFVGVAFGAKKLECLNKEVEACAQSLDIQNLVKEKDPCSKMPLVVDCFNGAVKKCNDEGKEAIQKIVNIAQELCKPNSQMYQDLMTHGKCFAKQTFLTNYMLNCLSEFGKEIGELKDADRTNMEEFANKVQNFVCPNREKMVNCGYGQIKSDCGEPAEKFFRNFVGPFDDLLKEACTDSAAIPSMSVAVIFLHLLIAFFTSRRIF